MPNRKHKFQFYWTIQAYKQIKAAADDLGITMTTMIINAIDLYLTIYEQYIEGGEVRINVVKKNGDEETIIPVGFFGIRTREREDS